MSAEERRGSIARMTPQVLVLSKLLPVSPM